MTDWRPHRYDVGCVRYGEDRERGTDKNGESGGCAKDGPNLRSHRYFVSQSKWPTQARLGERSGESRVRRGSGKRELIVRRIGDDGEV